MNPEALLRHIDTGQLWPHDFTQGIPDDVSAAYQAALQVRRLREQRGELPRGYKIGFTNRSIWERYQVFEPIWVRFGTPLCPWLTRRARVLWTSAT